ncbi:MAG: hypothetical protein KBD21_05295 [Candidatus Pacebacteria bacterium]|nr:hypothetical protein [Candidatus Paceibacterota bacterium]
MQQPTVHIDLDVLPIDLALWIGIIVAVVVFGIYSAVLLWHWKEYSTGRFTTVANMLVYLGVGAGCLIVMALATTWYGVV